MNPNPTPNPTYKRVYDHRIREAVCASGNPNLFPELEIPRSTALSWIRRGCPEPDSIIVALDEADEDFARLHDRVRRLELRAALQILKLSPSRYYAWKRAEWECELDDVVSCPRSKPSKLTSSEMMVIVEMALDETYRHLPVSRLALLA